MIEVQVVDNTRKLYNFNNQGYETLNLLIRRNADKFNDDDIGAIIAYINDEMHCANDLYFMLEKYGLFTALYYGIKYNDDNCQRISQAKFKAIKYIKEFIRKVY